MADDIGFDPVAWAINGGDIDADIMRVLGYASTGGAEGVITAGDCRVRPLDVPGAGVAIDTGAVAIRNASANVRNQTYIANGRRRTTLDTLDTDSTGARSDLVIVRTEDPQYGPWPEIPEEDAPDYQYVRPTIIPGVPPTTRKASELNLGYSAYALARIDRPASTGTVLATNIVDLRKVARPRRDQYLERFDIQYSPNDSGPDYNVWVKYPDVPFAYIEIPDYAAIAKVKAWVIGAQVRDAALDGAFRFKFTGGQPQVSAYSKETYINEQVPGDNRAGPYLVGSSVILPAGLRGVLAQCNIEFVRRNGGGFMRSHSDVQVVIEIDFIEAAS